MPKILLVDDEVDTRELLSRSLGRRGFMVATAADGKIALEMIDTSFDIVVTDLLMPRTDGISLLKELRCRNSPTIRVVITSFADKERAVNALNLGANYLVEKPFTSDQLADVLTHLLDERSSGTDLDTLFQRRLTELDLNDRQRILVAYLLKGLSNRQIADLSKTSEQTIKNSFHHIYQQLGIGSRGELFHLIFPT